MGEILPSQWYNYYGLGLYVLDVAEEMEDSEIGTFKEAFKNKRSQR